MSALIEEVRFAMDSPVEGSGFELSVPLRRATTSELSVPPAVNAVGARLPRKRPGVSAVGLASRFFDHVALTSRLARRGAVRAPAIEFKGAPALHNNAQTDEVS